MLQHLAVRNFQSLHKVDLALSRFTVIVGQSSSGKSAFIRALRALSSNVRGTSFITHGERSATITAVTDHGTVSLNKGARDEYTLIPANGEQQVFSKLGGDVPPEVSAVLGIQPKDALSFAGQFDVPFLLKSPPSEVARILGELTNADIVFSAARESNRRRLQSSSTLRVKAEDLADITARAQGYARLRGQLDAIATAEEYLQTARAVANRHAELDALLRLLQDSEQRQAAAALDADLLIPDLTPASTAQQRLDLLTTLLGASARQKRSVDDAHKAIGRAGSELEALEQEYLDTLHDLGTCPTCGQSTGGVAHIV